MVFFFNAKTGSWKKKSFIKFQNPLEHVRMHLRKETHFFRFFTHFEALTSTHSIEAHVIYSLTMDRFIFKLIMINYPLFRISMSTKFGCKWSILLKVTSFSGWCGDHDKIFSLVFLFNQNFETKQKGLFTKPIIETFIAMWMQWKISKIDNNNRLEYFSVEKMSLAWLTVTLCGFIFPIIKKK